MINRDYYLKQHRTVVYLGCYPDSDLSGESMARRVLKKINTKLNLLFRRVVYNALIQAQFDYGCTSWSIS